MNYNEQTEHAQFATIAAGRQQVFYVESGPRDSRAEFVTTWMGTPVLRITRYNEWKQYTPTGGFYERCHVTGVDLAGRTWKGYGMGRGMMCRMHMDFSYARTED